MAVGLILATVIVFQQPLQSVLAFARDVELRYHLDLIPALVTLVGVFVFHVNRKRLQAKAEAAAAAAEAADARARADELERLNVFSRALSNARDRTALQQTLWQYLPALTGGREFWVLTTNGTTEALVRDANSGRTIEQMEAATHAAIASQDTATPTFHGIPHDGDVCFPLYAGGNAVGVFGVRATIPLGPTERQVLGAVAVLVAIAVTTVAIFVETREHSVRDSLTGCFNRKHAFEVLDTELRRAKRNGLPVSLIMFDVDRFKTINDERGHLAGDAILGAIGARLNAILRTTDVRCRYGGDEFVIILPDTPALGAQQVAECIRREVASLRLEDDGGQLSVTTSLGVALAEPGELDGEALIARADEALYRAKRSGRNRFCVSTSVHQTGASIRPFVRTASGA